jgi:hypothetical protein
MAIKTLRSNDRENKYPDPWMMPHKHKPEESTLIHLDRSVDTVDECPAGKETNRA